MAGGWEYPLGIYLACRVAGVGVEQNEFTCYLIPCSYKLDCGCSIVEVGSSLRREPSRSWSAVRCELPGRPAMGGTAPRAAPAASTPRPRPAAPCRPRPEPPHSQFVHAQSPLLCSQEPRGADTPRDDPNTLSQLLLDSNVDRNLLMYLGMLHSVTKTAGSGRLREDRAGRARRWPSRRAPPAGRRAPAGRAAPPGRGRRG